VSTSLVVVGDTLLDRDIVGSVGRVCTDAPAPIVRVERETARPGGAGLAALLGRHAGADVTLVTALADDAGGELLRRMLAEAGVDLVDLGRSGPTIEKVRVLGGHQPMLRFDRGQEQAPVASHPGPDDDRLEALLASAGAVLVADYAMGVTRAPGVRIQLERHASRVPVVWDPHPRGPEPVPNVRLVTPTAHELSVVVGRAGGAEVGAGEIEDAARRYGRAVRAAAVAVTMGARGAMLVDGATPLVVPAPFVAHSDTVGAGDCFALSAAYALALGAVVSEAVETAVLRASEFVAAGGVGGLCRDGSGAGPDGSAPARTDDAETVVARVRARHGTVVATGGCFDILHAGHVSMLQAARRLGDCLVVLVNSDDSVRRLKGPERPCQTAADRAAVLLALECVDAVEIFDEATPAVPLERLRPDIFAKGADYAASPLAERDIVAK
jgi:D-beta-D-heptose 7-phosphate kinase / D-beta-D-heptose 1-phosphate adenosyltransferase